MAGPVACFSRGWAKNLMGPDVWVIVLVGFYVGVKRVKAWLFFCTLFEDHFSFCLAFKPDCEGVCGRLWTC